MRTKLWFLLALACVVAVAALFALRSTGDAQGRGGQVDLLARVVAAEAEGEPYQGQVAVAAVILNRVGSSQFPNSLSGVVFQPHAFESVSNGLIWRRSPSREAISAARDALNGVDPTYGCIFFWNPSKPVSGWIWSRPVAVRIGSHVFAR
ncbi:MAG: Spore cortex-lytic enzyme precursor [Firmicutes bacterium ADurb.Bin506]|jgi:N-acetylmuramoyl-L-alanine amidase|nr:MAG: Spore cortex-lytic enzyme precursor [Firmicutes bacterium ADurb.Bin506]